MSDVYKKLVAKSSTTNYQTLLMHSINCGTIATQILSSEKFSPILAIFENEYSIPKDDIIHLIGWAAAVHDIGKASPYFQVIDEKAKKELDAEGIKTKHLDESFRHERYSYKIIAEYLKNKDWDEDSAENIAAAVMYHHEGKNGIWREPENSTARTTWKNIQMQIIDDISEIFILPDIDFTEFETKIDAFFNFMEAIINLSDWISSSDKFKSDESCDDVLLYSGISEERARECLSKIGILKNNTLPKTLTVSDIDEKITTPRPLQIAATELSQSIKDIRLVIVEAPTGEGKTEAAELLASRIGEGKRGMAFALPTAATVDSIFKRVTPVFAKYDADVVKTHSLSKLDDGSFVSTAEDADWLRPSRLNFFMKNVICTVDQVMMSTLPFRYSKLRLLGLTDKVLIIDEIHAYDAYMNTIIERLLMWAREYEIPVILLSATLPLKKKKGLIKAYAGKDCDISGSDEYPLITVLDKEKNIYLKKVETPNGREFEVEVLDILNDYEKIWHKISPVASNGGNIGIIFNTVGEAQACYKVIKKKFDNTMLLTARTKAKYRKEKSELCEKMYGPKRESTSKSKGSIIIATQVIEQSLNIDLDWILTALCPIDLIIQRYGREQRFNFISRPKWLEKKRMTVLTMPIGTFNVSEIVYSSYILRMTEEILNLKKGKTIKIPEDTRDLIESVYADITKEKLMKEWTDSQTKTFQEYEQFIKLQKVMAEAAALPDPSPDLYYKKDGGILFTDDKLGEGNITAALTRLGEPTQRIILIDEKEFSKYNFNSLSNDECNELLSESLTLSSKKVYTDYEIGFIPPIKIESGPLQNTIVYATKKDEYHFRRKMFYRISLEADLEILEKE